MMLFASHRALTQYPDYASRFGRSLTSVFVQCQAIAGTILALLLTGGVISSERSDRTLETLLSTNISTTQLVLSKSASRTFALLLAMIGLAPISAITMWYGGVSAEQIILAEALVLLAVLVGASVGTFFSCIARTACSGIISAFVFLSVFWGSTAAVLATVCEWGKCWSSLGRWVFSFTPFGAIGDLGPGMDSFAKWCFLINVPLSVVFVWSSILVMRLRPHVSGEGGFRRYVRIVSSAVAKLLGTRRRSNAAIKGNPIVWRELRRRFIGGWTLWATILVIAWALLFAVFALAWALQEVDDDEFRIPTILVLSGALFITTSIVSGTAFSPEVEAKSFDLLVLTDLRVRDLLWGKLLGIARFAVIPASLLFGAFSLMYLSLYQPLIMLLVSPPRYCIIAPCLFAVFIMLHVVFFALAGVWMSLLCRRTASAIGWSIAWPVFFCVVTMVIVFLLDARFGIRNEGRWITATNPFGPYVWIADELPHIRQRYFLSSCIQGIWLLCGCVCLFWACVSTLRRKVSPKMARSH